MRCFRFGKGNTRKAAMPATIGRWRVLRPMMTLGAGARYGLECMDCAHTMTARGSDVRRRGMTCPKCRATQKQEVAGGR
jgi:hypothetical protein